MKAVQLVKANKHNPIIKAVTVPNPTNNDNQVLIKVEAAAINPVDWLISTNSTKAIIPISLPHVLGFEFAGKVIKVGKNVHDFKVEDRVYAMMPKENFGAEAELVTIDEKYLAKIPSYLTYEQAAAIPLAALTAEQAYDLMGVQSGKIIFISGGTGSVGALAIPLAKARGLKVITNGSSRNEKRVKKLGVDQFIDYHTQDYSKVLSNIDYVLDTRGNKEIPKEISILKPGGKIVSLIGSPNKRFARRWGSNYIYTFIMGLLGKKFDELATKHGNSSYDFIFGLANGDQLRNVSKYLEANKIPIEIGKLISWEEAPSAIKDTIQHHSNGKTIINFAK